MWSTKQDKKKRFALVDCNNFYASCERVFHPQWQKRPVVVLSNNDGCIVARSSEAKALGIPMGAPLFEWREILERNRAVVCSSNYVLYGDLSKRVMESLRTFTPDIEVYSIDEAFLLLATKTAEEVAQKAKKQIAKWTGIPVSIGLAPTKTLAKVANHYAKKHPETGGVYRLDDPKCVQEHLEQLTVTEIWGIGRRIGLRLARFGIRSAWQFAQAEDGWIRRHFHVTGLRTAYELRGISCLPLERGRAMKKSICHSRSFSTPVSTFSQLSEALSTFTAKAAEKARKERACPTSLTIFAVLHPFTLHFTSTAQVTLPEPTHYTPLLLKHAKQALEKIYRPDHSYRKVGIILDGLVAEEHVQGHLFAKRPTLDQEKLMDDIDLWNRQRRRKRLKFAAEGVRPKWTMQRDHCTPHYTTSWSELLKIYI